MGVVRKHRVSKKKIAGGCRHPCGSAPVSLVLLSCARLLGGAVWHFERKKKTENTALLAEHLQQVRHRNYNYTV